MPNWGSCPPSCRAACRSLPVFFFPSRRDGHLLSNNARVLYDLHEYERSVGVLVKALDSNPEFAEARRMLAVVERLHLLEPA